MIKKSNLLIITILIAAALILMYCGYSMIEVAFKKGELVYPSKNELGKGLFHLGIGAGLGGLIKFLLDLNKSSNDKYEDMKRISSKIKNSIIEISHNLEDQRILISTHKSALTYGKSVRNVIMPSITKLKALKISESNKKLHNYQKQEDLALKFNSELDVIIDYLQSIVDEFQKSYLRLAHKQEYLEKIKESMARNYAIPKKENGEKIDFASLIDELDEHLKNKKLPIQDYKRTKKIYEQELSFDELNNFLNYKKSSDEQLIFEKQITNISSLVQLLKWNPVYNML